MSDTLLTTMIGIWLISSFFTAAIASGKNRDAIGWFFLGLLFGPLTLLVIAAVSAGPEVPNEPSLGLSNGESLSAEIWRLAELHRDGALTDAEFAAAKARAISTN